MVAKLFFDPLPCVLIRYRDIEPLVLHAQISGPGEPALKAFPWQPAAEPLLDLLPNVHSPLHPRRLFPLGTPSRNGGSLSLKPQAHVLHMISTVCGNFSTIIVADLWDRPGDVAPIQASDRLESHPRRLA